MKKRGSKKGRLPRPFFIDFGLIFGSFWEQNGVQNPSKKGSIFRSKKGCKTFFKTTPSAQGRHQPGEFWAPGPCWGVWGFNINNPKLIV